MSSMYHESKLKPQPLSFPKKVFKSLYSNCSYRCKMRRHWGQFSFILCNWWNRKQRLVHYLWKECGMVPTSLSYYQCFSWYKTTFLQGKKWGMNAGKGDSVLTWCDCLSHCQHITDITVEMNNRRFCSRHCRLCPNFPCWISLGAVKIGLAVIRGKKKKKKKPEDFSCVGGKVSASLKVLISVFTETVNEDKRRRK